MIHFFKNQIRFSARHFVRHRSGAKFYILGLMSDCPTNSITKGCSLKEFTIMDEQRKKLCSWHMFDLSRASAGHHQECARLGSAKQPHVSGQGRDDCIFLFWVMALSFLFCQICRQTRWVVFSEIRVFSSKRSLTSRAWPDAVGMCSPKSRAGWLPVTPASWTAQSFSSSVRINSPFPGIPLKLMIPPDHWTSLHL